MALQSAPPSSLSTHTATLLARALLFATCLWSLVRCPHSKVEESFQLQATHDLYYHGLFADWQHYDHLQYPGVVPRTFAGPLILAICCRAITYLVYPFVDLASHPLMVQFLSRFVLMCFVLHGWFRLANAVSLMGRDGGNQSLSAWTGAYLLVVTAVQFHMTFYSSRMLPNTFALVVLLHTFTSWISSSRQASFETILGLGIATIVFRCDVILLCVPVGLSLLWRGQVSLYQGATWAVCIAFTCLALTVPLDSHLWQKWVWPEGQVFYYNAILGKSSNWGTLPAHWYWTNAIPKAMLGTLLLVPLGLCRLPEVMVNFVSSFSKQKPTDSNQFFEIKSYGGPFFLPVIIFVGMYSCLGHKELRFLFPALPILNLGAAMGLTRLHNVATSVARNKKNDDDDDKNRKSPPLSLWAKRMARAMWWMGAVLLVSTLGMSLVFVQVSRQNYPGGDALLKLIQLTAAATHDDEVSTVQQQLVHVDVAAAMTGVSLFAQRAGLPDLQFIKSGYEDVNAVTSMDQFDYLLAEKPVVSNKFEVVAVIPGHPRLNIKRFRIDTKDAIYIHRRRH